MKKVYFVRHGESEGNAQLFHHAPATPLSKIGQIQAKIVAERFTHFQSEIIISSPFLRAQQTAQAIATATKLKIETTDLFGEKRGPSKLQGLSLRNQASINTRQTIHQHFLDDNGHWQLADEESYFDFNQRMIKALRFLQNKPEERIIAVCHSLVISAIFAHILSPQASLAEIHDIAENIKQNNTGISIAAFDEEAEKWQVVCLNDHAHLS